MPNAEPCRLSATTLVRQIEEGKLTAEAVVASCLERIAEREPVVKAWTHIAREAALAEARAVDKAGKRSLLNGVPFALKDIFDTADMPTGYGSPIYTGCQPAADAAAAALPRAAGGILLGKTVSTEFAYLHPAPTLNPHHPDFSPGGSSSGSAAAVGDFMVPLAIGTQTGGSVIRPATYCGVVGFKPSYALFPPGGVRINTDCLDTVGIMARGVADIALFRAAMMAIPYEPPALPESAPRLLLCRGPSFESARPEGRETLAEAARRLAAAGAAIVEEPLPKACEEGLQIQRHLTGFEAARNHMPELHRHEALLSPRLSEKIALGRMLPYAEFVEACEKAERARRAARDWLAGFDAVLTLAAPGEAPRGLADTGSPAFNSLWTLLYLPCLTLPAGTGPEGLPVGVQLVGRRNADSHLLATALWVERQLGRRPRPVGGEQP